MKRTPSLRAAMSSFSISSIEATRISRDAPPRRARAGSAFSAARAPPKLVTRARKVRGPTFSDRTSRSQSKRCWSVRRNSGLIAIPSGFPPNFRLGAVEKAGDVRAVLEPDQRRQRRERQSRAALPSRRQGDRGSDGRRERRRRRVTRERRNREPDDSEHDRRRPGKADEAAKVGRNALAA